MAGELARYQSFMDVVRHRMTNRAFASSEIPRDHFELILEAARHAPSGANAQPWHYIIVTDPETKKKIRSEEHTSELQSLTNLVCRLLLEKKKKKKRTRSLNQTQTTRRTHD